MLRLASWHMIHGQKYTYDSNVGKDCAGKVSGVRVAEKAGVCEVIFILAELCLGENVVRNYSLVVRRIYL